MLQKITSSPSKLGMGRGSHGVTAQEITVELEALVTWIGGIVPR